MMDEAVTRHVSNTAFEAIHDPHSTDAQGDFQIKRSEITDVSETFPFNEKTSCSASIREGLNLLLHGKQKASLAQRAAGAIGGTQGHGSFNFKYFKGYGSSGQS